jgi:hypothetical protein
MFPKPVPRVREPKRLTRKTWMRKSKPKRLSKAGSDPAYLGKVRALPCFVASGLCWGRIHAHHAVHLSQGGKDADAVPLCAYHHRAWHECAAPFAGLSKLARFAWAVNAVARTRSTINGRAA